MDVDQLKTKAEKDKHTEEVRNAGLNVITEKKDTNMEVDLEIEAPGAAVKVAEDGAQTIQSQDEFNKLAKQLVEARKRPENQLG